MERWQKHPLGDWNLAVEENEARLRALIEASPLGIVIMDLSGSPVFFNPKCEELHGIDYGSAGGRGWERAVHPEDRERIARSWYAAARAGRSWSETYRFLHADGRVVWVTGRAEPIHVRGERVGFVGTLEDITEHKEAEAEREALLERERAARLKAEEATRLREATLAAVAHELRTPLATIATSIDALLVLGSDAREIAFRQLEIVRRTLGRMDRLIAGLLDIGQMQSGTFEVRPAPLSLPALLAETTEIFASRAMEQGVALIVELPPDLPDVLADRERLDQVLTNLIDNALKLTPEGGSIHIRAEPLDGRVRVSVEDTGPGVPSDAVDRVFDSFWQADRESGAGIGLGLAISKGIVEAHGGAIWVEEGEIGARFCLTLARA